jgi:hypothetical protein
MDGAQQDPVIVSVTFDIMGLSSEAVIAARRQDALSVVRCEARNVVDADRKESRLALQALPDGHAKAGQDFLHLRQLVGRDNGQRPVSGREGGQGRL